MPEPTERAGSTCTWLMGTAGLDTGAAWVRPVRAGAATSTVPHAWHSPQRPTHLLVVHPHSAQTYAGRAVLVLAMSSA
jgi:hypothetical protein